MAQHIYVDNSNVWIEGQRVHAFQKGKSASIHSITPKMMDKNWRFDFGQLVNCINGKPQSVGRAVLFGSRPPLNDSLWNAISKQGYQVFIEDRNLDNQEKKIDTGIVSAIMSDCLKGKIKKESEGDEIVLVAGDSDYVPMIRDLKELGYRVKVVFWSHASRELKNIASQFKSLDEHLELLTR